MDKKRYIVARLNTIINSKVLNLWIHQLKKKFLDLWVNSYNFWQIFDCIKVKWSNNYQWYIIFFFFFFNFYNELIVFFHKMPNFLLSYFYKLSVFNIFLKIVISDFDIWKSFICKNNNFHNLRRYYNHYPAKFLD